ncbi:MAG: hypothetical protein M1157_07625 [Deinococcus sp.]|nr:hypothetical protein [Deinococcus sp.]
MPEVKLTTFVDFVIASGTPRITCIRKAKRLYSQDYKPAFDYWRLLRNQLVEMHEQNLGKQHLDDVVNELNDSRKVEAYQKCIQTYKRWMGRKQLAWMGCSTADWKSGHLKVRVNPELGLQINNSPYIIKLYFRAKEPSKGRLATMLYLMETTLLKQSPHVTPAILDVHRGRLIKPTSAVQGIDVLLEAEAAAFVMMWDQT